MSAFLKGLAVGSAPRVANVLVTDYATPPAGAESLITHRYNTLALPGNPESFELTSVPTEGRYFVRSDGLLGIDLNDVDVLGESTIFYNDTTGGGSTPLSFLFDPQTSKERFGFGKGRHYLLEVDSNLRSVWEPVPINNRVIYIDTDGLTKLQIEARENENMTAAELKNQPAVIGSDIPEANGVLRYGEIPELAVDEQVAKLIANLLGPEEGAGCYALLFRVGKTYSVWSGGGANDMRGWSPLHPMYVGVWGGSGFATLNTLPSYDCGIVQGNIRCTGTVKNEAVRYHINEFVDFRGQISFNSGKYGLFGLTSRCNRHTDVYPRTPKALKNDPTTWDVWRAHEVGQYLAGFDSVLCEWVFQDFIGWGPLYDRDGDINEPNPANQFSHNNYCDGGNSDITVRYNLLGRGSLTVMQARSGVVMYDTFAYGANQQLLVAPGKTYDAASDTYNGHFSYVLDSVFTEAGQKDETLYNMKTDLGIRNKSFNFSVRNSVLCNKGQPPVLAIDLAHPRTSGDNAYNDDNGSTFILDLAIYGWPNAANQNVEGLDPSVLNNTTIQKYHDQWQSVLGSHRTAFYASLRALEAPWTQVKDILQWFLGNFNRSKPTKTIGDNVVFEPYFTGETPGNRWDIRMDWSSGIVPGTVVGDSVDLNGYIVNNFDNPLNDLVNMSLGDGGKLHKYGGRINLTGDLSGTGLIELEGSGQLWMAGGTVASTVDIDVNVGGRFANSGAMTYNGDIEISGRSELLLSVADTNSFVMNGELTYSGQSRLGFDGPSGAASLTFGNSAVVNVHPVHRVYVDMDSAVTGGTGFPIKGDSVTGQTSGFTGILEYIETLSNSDNAYFNIRVLTGTPQVGENIRGQRYFNRPFGFTNPNVQTNIAQIVSIGSIVYPRINKFVSGALGINAPGIASTINLDGTLVVNQQNVPTGEYILMQADTFTGDFDTKPSNVAIDGNNLVLTVT